MEHVDSSDMLVKQLESSESLVRHLESSMEHLYNSDNLDMYERLELAKSDLKHGIEKDVKANEIIHASLERRKQVLHKRHLELEQDVSRL